MPEASATDLELLKLLDQQTCEQSRHDLLAFAIYTRDHYEPNWHHRKMCEILNKFVDGEIKRLIVCMPPRHGKALEVATPLPTPDGWKKIGDMKPGDYVFDLHGNPTKIVAVSSVWKDRAIYKVYGKEAEPIYADGQHEWLVRLCRKRKKYFLKTTSILEQRSCTRRPLVDHHKGLNLPDRDLPIDPWMLGVWLGDGCSHHATITQGNQDLDFVRAKIEGRGYETTNRITKNSFGVLDIQEKMKNLGLMPEKFIPMDYLRSSKKQRLALLQGLIDTAGHVALDGQVEFCSVNKKLAEGCAELVRSLGVKCNIITGRTTYNGKDCGEKYRVMFYMKDAASLPRKAKYCRDGKKQIGLYLNFEKTGSIGDTICIQVDSFTSMFLAGRSMVPTHNSELVSRCLPAYALGKNPDEAIIATSYSAALASRMNRDVQRLIEGTSYKKVFPEMRLSEVSVKNANQQSYLRNATMFEAVDHKGSYTSAGVGGGITGVGADIGIIDDPFKNQEGAYSTVYREKVWEWYTSTFMTRLQGERARVLVTMTRWHEDDLVGRLLKQAKKDPQADQWHVISWPAICEVNHEDDPREIGEELWPSHFPKEFLLKNKANGEYFWNALFQQRPAPREGGIIKREWIRYYDELPADTSEWMQSWDLTFDKTTSGSFVVGSVWCRKGANIYLVDRFRKRLDFPGQIKAIKNMTIAYPQADVKLVEKAANGHAVLSSLRDEVSGLIAVTPRGSKEARLSAVSPLFESGNVYFPKTNWIDELTEELVSFPNAPFDDQVDSLSQALNRYKTTGITNIQMSMDIGLHEGMTL